MYLVVGHGLHARRSALQNQQGLTFQSGNGWATITVAVNDPNVPGKNRAAVTGIITAHVSPEPVTLSLIGTGLLGLAVQRVAAARIHKLN